MLGEPPRPRRPVRLRLTAGGPPAPVPGIDAPAPYPEDKLVKGNQDADYASQVLKGRAAVWGHRVATGDIDGLWEQWNRAAELYLDKVCEVTGKRHHGRGKVRRRRHIATLGPKAGADHGGGTAQGVFADHVPGHLGGRGLQPPPEDGQFRLAVRRRRGGANRGDLFQPRHLLGISPAALRG